MVNKLTLKQSKFVQKLVETNNGTEAAVQTYDVKNRNVASGIAFENLRKPNIQQAIRQSLEAKGLNTESIAEYLKTAIVSGLGQRATNADALRGIDIYARLTGAYESYRIEQSYKVKVKKMSDKELVTEFEETRKVGTALLDELEQ